MSDVPRTNRLAELLNRLFDEVRPPERGGRRYTNDEVAAAVKEMDSTIRVGGAYLSALRNGTKKHPSTDLLAALARHFDKPIAYFFGDAGSAGDSAEAELARLADNTQVRRLALRALDLSPQGLAAVTRLVEQALEADQRLRSTDRPDDLAGYSDSGSQGPG